MRKIVRVNIYRKKKDDKQSENKSTQKEVPAEEKGMVAVSKQSHGPNEHNLLKLSRSGILPNNSTPEKWQ